jgi:replicative DNA helicase
VSLAEVMTPYRDEPSSSSIDRTPPQDMAAEQCVLGAMLMSKDAIADVVEALRGGDFYRPAHEQVYDAILDLYGRGEPADAITVSAELGKRGELGRIGGAPYLHTLLASVPVAANAGYYAEIVREKAILRRLVDASIKIGQMSYAAEGDVDVIVDRAQAEVYGVTERRTSEDFKPLSELMQPTLDEMEAISSRGGQLAGVPTGFAELDDLTNGLHAGQMVIVAARPGCGKALALDTPLPTPTGWTSMGAVHVGDELLGADGRPTRVVATTEVMNARPCFQITFSDGTTVVADAEHEWSASSRAARRAATERRPARTYFDKRLAIAASSASERATAEVDRWVTMGDLVDEVGEEFKHVLRSISREAQAAVRVPALPSGKESFPAAVVYPRQAMLLALAARVGRSINSWPAAEHQAVVTTAQMAEKVMLDGGRANWSIETSAPLLLEEADLPLHPYALGVWLGDGHSAAARFASADPQISGTLSDHGLAVAHQTGLNYSICHPRDRVRMKVREVGGQGVVPARVDDAGTYARPTGGAVRRLGTTSDMPTCPDCGAVFAGGRCCRNCHAQHGSALAVLGELGVLHNKHIPMRYLRASETQRRDLLAGLLDTRGTVGEGGRIEFAVTSARLADGFFELATSLGYRCSRRKRPVAGRRLEPSTAYSITFVAVDDVFRLPCKMSKHRAVRTNDPSRSSRRYVTSVEPVPSVGVRCVQVDNSEHLYLATEAMVPTHNSTLALDLARSASIRHGLTSVIFSLEMSQIEITMRLLSAEASIPLSHIRGGRMSDEDWGRVATKMGQVSEAPLFIDDSPNLTMMEIRAKARRLKQRHDLKLVVIDYIQLMTSGKRVESRQLEVSEFSRQIKLLAKELDVPVVALSQLNRGPEQRTDKRPLLADLRESGSLEQDSDLVVLLNRPDLYDKESERAGEADFDVAKHRNGPTKVLTVAFQGHYSRFTDMQH